MTHEPRLSELTERYQRDREAHAVSAYARALLAAGGHARAALGDLEHRYGAKSPVLDYAKAAVTAHSSADPGALTALRASTSAFLDRNEARLLQQLRGLRTVPMNVRVPLVTQGTIAAWFVAGGPMPASAMALDVATLTPCQIGTILTVSQELMRSAAPQATQLLEADLQAAIARLENDHLLSDAPAVAQLQPAGLLYGLSAVGGGSPSTLEADISALWGSVRGGNPERPYFITSPTAAMYLSSMRDAGGKLFPGVGAGGGDVGGVPLLIARAAGSRLILVDAAALAVADTGLTLDVSGEASIQMSDGPTNGAANLVSAFQSDSSFLRITRIITWALGHPDGAAFVDLPPAAGSPS